MKSISRKEFDKKVQVGDLFYVEDEGLVGWRICLTKGDCVGMNTENDNSWCNEFANFYHNITKVIFVREIISPYYFSEFLHRFDINVLFSNDVYLVEDNPKKEIDIESLVEKLNTRLEELKEALYNIRT